MTGLIKRTAVVGGLALALAACANNGYNISYGYNDPYNNRSGGTDWQCVGGTVAGGVAGAVVGNQFGGGSGKTAMTAAGAAGGALAGRQLACNPRY